MPPVPTVCQPIADEISALEAQDSQLRTQLSTLTGADALAVLSQIASGRETLEAKKAELEACILANTAALQGQVVVIGVGPPTSAESRVSESLILREKHRFRWRPSRSKPIPSRLPGSCPRI
jgi:hypothetical protein